MGLSKKAAVGTLVEMMSLIIGAFFVLTIFSVITAEAEEKTSEILCRGFNILSVATETRTLGVKTFSSPQACKTIHKIGADSVPSKGYEQGEKGIGKQITDMTVKCYWMWLDGKIKNMFDGKSYYFNDPGFICYSFTIKDNIKSAIEFEDLEKELLQPYHAIDKTERCAPAGRGGYCVDYIEGQKKEAIYCLLF